MKVFVLNNAAIRLFRQDTSRIIGSLLVRHFEMLIVKGQRVWTKRCARTGFVEMTLNKKILF